MDYRVTEPRTLPTQPLNEEERLVLRLFREMSAAKTQFESALRRDDRWDRDQALLRYLEAKSAMALVGGFDDLDDRVASQTLREGIKTRVFRHPTERR